MTISITLLNHDFHKSVVISNQDREYESGIPTENFKETSREVLEPQKHKLVYIHEGRKILLIEEK